jgi:intracellular sulfur oxidation DsrE/DsrF family protein
MRGILAFVFMLFCAFPVFAEDRVVYHIENAAEQALKGLRNIRNQLDVAPDTKIAVVAHSDGVDFLFDGARDPKSNTEYGPLISGLKTAGVAFEVCEITLKRRNLSKDKFVMEVDYTPSGVVRITQLQNRDHYAYVKP